VSVMKRVTTYTERNNPLTVQFPGEPDSSRQSAISSAVINLAQDIRAKAIVAETSSGATAVHLSAYRSKQPIVAVASEKRVAQQLAIVYGVKTYIQAIDKLAATKVTNWLLQNKILKKGDIVVTASGKHPGVVGTTDTIKVRVL
jgi:pyruvate kinase